MNPIKKIIAFFRFRGEEIEMEAKSVSIKNGIAYLRPSTQPEVTYAIKTENARVFLDVASDEDVQIIEKSNEEEPPTGNHNDKTDSSDQSSKSGKRTRTRQATPEDILSLKKKTFSTGFFDHERVEIVNAYKSAGARRDEYLLACVRAASPRKVSIELRKIRKQRESMPPVAELP